jgi:site-specific recombinase XerD
MDLISSWPIRLSLARRLSLSEAKTSRTLSTGLSSKSDQTEGAVFLSSTVRPCRVENLSRTCSRLRDLAGLPKDLVLYLARHECGTKICREKGIEYARRLLGHTNISTTQRYMHLDDSELADAQDLIDCRAGPWTE